MKGLERVIEQFADVLDVPHEHVVEPLALLDLIAFQQ